MTEALMGVSPLRTDLPIPTLPPLGSHASSDVVQRKPAEVTDGVMGNAGANVKAPAANLFSREELADTLHQMNIVFDMFDVQAQFSVSEENHQIQVVLRNRRTGEVVRRIPPDEFAGNVASFKDGIGLLFNRLF